MLRKHAPYVISAAKIQLPGEQVAAEELVDLGVEWVILGHSERRQIIGESNQFVGDKVAYALEQKLKVMACIGETINQRENGQVGRS